MLVLLWILISTFLISLLAFVGVLTLFFSDKLLNKALLILVSFSAGALLGSAFFHLIPEAVAGIGSNEKEILKIFGYLVFGYCVFFILEEFISWHHHHTTKHPEIASFSYLILISDSIHNFIDGLIIAASFVVSVPVGLAAVLAVTFHEIPQEIGDYGVLVYGGFNRFRALFLNFLSAIIGILGGLIGFFLWQQIGQSMIYLLPFAAGNFIYIASSDLIPEIKNNSKEKKSVWHFLVFVLGILLMLLLKIS